MTVVRRSASVASRVRTAGSRSVTSRTWSDGVRVGTDTPDRVCRSARSPPRPLARSTRLWIDVASSPNTAEADRPSTALRHDRVQVRPARKHLADPQPNGLGGGCDTAWSGRPRQRRPPSRTPSRSTGQDRTRSARHTGERTADPVDTGPAARDSAGSAPRPPRPTSPTPPPSRKRPRGRACLDRRGSRVGTRCSNPGRRQ